MMIQDSQKYPETDTHIVRYDIDDIAVARCKNILKITAFSASLILFSASLIASLVSTGVLTETFVFYSHHIGQLESSIFFTLSLISTLALGMILCKPCIFSSKVNDYKNVV